MSGRNDVAISADGVPVRYEVHGEGTPALVFVHGWCCDRSYWGGQLDHFAQQHNVVLIDLAGHGESGVDRKTWTIAAFGEDVVAVVDRLDLEQVVLVGQSMGGPVVVDAASRMPDRVVGLIGVDTLRDVERSRTPEQVMEFLAPFRGNFVEAPRKFVRDMFVPSSDPALVEQIVADMSAAPQDVGIGAMEGLRSIDLNLRTALHEVSAPIVAINSDYRPNNIDAAQRHGIEVVLMSNVGHFVMMEDPEVFNRLLDEAVKKCVGALERE